MIYPKSNIQCIENEMRFRFHKLIRVKRSFKSLLYAFTSFCHEKHNWIKSESIKYYGITFPKAKADSTDSDKNSDRRE